MKPLFVRWVWHTSIWISLDILLDAPWQQSSCYVKFLWIIFHISLYSSNRWLMNPSLRLRTVNRLRLGLLGDMLSRGMLIARVLQYIISMSFRCVLSRRTTPEAYFIILDIFFAFEVATIFHMVYRIHYYNLFSSTWLVRWLCFIGGNVKLSDSNVCPEYLFSWPCLVLRISRT